MGPNKKKMKKEKLLAFKKITINYNGIIIFLNQHGKNGCPKIKKNIYMLKFLKMNIKKKKNHIKFKRKKMRIECEKMMLLPTNNVRYTNFFINFLISIYVTIEVLYFDWHHSNYMINSHQ